MANANTLLDRPQVQVLLQFVQNIGEMKPSLQPADDRQENEKSGKQRQEDDSCQQIIRRMSRVVADVVRVAEDGPDGDQPRDAKQDQNPQELDRNRSSARQLNPAP